MESPSGRESAWSACSSRTSRWRRARRWPWPAFARTPLAPGGCTARSCPSSGKPRPPAGSAGISSGCRSASVAPLELVSQLGRQALDDQRAGFFVVFDLRAQQVRFKADGQPFSAPGEAAELVQGALIRRNLRGQAVILVADVIVEGFRAFFVDQLREFFQAHRLAEFGLAAGVINQGFGFLAGGLFRQVFAFDEVTEGFEQGAGFAGAVDAFLAADEVAEILRNLFAVLAFDKRNVLLGLLVVLPLGNVDPRRQVQLAQIKVAGRGDVQRFGHGNAFAVEIG